MACGYSRIAGLSAARCLVGLLHKRAREDCQHGMSRERVQCGSRSNVDPIVNAAAWPCVPTRA